MTAAGGWRSERGHKGPGFRGLDLATLSQSPSERPFSDLVSLASSFVSPLLRRDILGRPHALRPHTAYFHTFAPSPRTLGRRPRKASDLGCDRRGNGRRAAAQAGRRVRSGAAGRPVGAFPPPRTACPRPVPGEQPPASR